MKLLVAITTYSCYFWVMILSDDENEVMTALSSHLRNNNTGDLLYVLELAFCQNKVDGTTCNSAEGKVCMNGRCVSACRMNQSADLSTSCLCNSTAHMCHLCCWSSADKSCQTASTYGIYMDSRNSMSWKLKNSLNGCPLDPFNIDGGVCPSDATGRICDLVPRDGLEEPWVCLNRQCSRITCTHFNRILSSMAAYPSTIIDCQCRNEFAQYAACCRDLNNNTCYPYQTWVMGDRGQSYMKALGIDNTSASLENLIMAYSSGGLQGSNGGGGDGGNNGGDQSSGDHKEGNSPSSHNEGGNKGKPSQDASTCQNVGSDGTSCGIGKWCVDSQCVYLCSSDNFDCWCKKIGSTPNCSVCCLTSDYKCQKVGWTQNMSEVIFARKPLTKAPCNFSYAMCSKEIQAKTADPTCTYGSNTTSHNCQNFVQCSPGSDYSIKDCKFSSQQCKAVKTQLDKNFSESKFTLNFIFKFLAILTLFYSDYF